MKLLFIQKIKGFSGSEKFILEMIPALLARGHACHFLAVYHDASDLDNVKGRFQDKGIHCIYLQTNSDLNRRLLKNIQGIIKEGAYDLVHSHLIHADVWVALIKLFFNKKLKIVSTKHNYDEAYTNKHGFDPAYLKWRDRYFFLTYWAERKINYAITVSHGLYDLYVKGKISKENQIRCIPSGFDLPHFEPVENSACRLSSHQLVIVGRLVGFKGHRFAIEAVDLLLPRYPDLKLVIVGEGEEAESLQKLAQAKGLEEAIVFTGYQNNVFEWMHQSDVVLLPSVSEGFGIVILEAFNSRSPLIAFDVPAPNEIIEDGKTGLLVKPYEVDDLAEKIDSLLKSPEKRAEIAKQAFFKLKSYYSMDRMITETLEVYEQVLAQT